MLMIITVYNTFLTSEMFAQMKTQEDYNVKPDLSINDNELIVYSYFDKHVQAEIPFIWETDKSNFGEAFQSLNKKNKSYVFNYDDVIHPSLKLKIINLSMYPAKNLMCLYSYDANDFVKAMHLIGNKKIAFYDIKSQFISFFYLGAEQYAWNPQKMNCCTSQKPQYIAGVLPFGQAQNPCYLEIPNEYLICCNALMSLYKLKNDSFINELPPLHIYVEYTDVKNVKYINNYIVNFTTNQTTGNNLNSGLNIFATVDVKNTRTTEMQKTLFK